MQPTENLFKSFQRRLKELSEGELDIIRALIDALEDANRFQDIGINFIPKLPHWKSKEKSDMLNYTLKRQKNYENLIEFFKQIKTEAENNLT